MTDFGIARALASINPEEESDVVWGSPQYFSPEQAGGGPPSPSSDVYSLGIVMYQMFTGQLPFIGKTSTELARLHRRAKPIPPRELNPFITPELEQVILKVLSKEPSARYRTADQLGRVLQTLQGKNTPQQIKDASRRAANHVPPDLQETIIEPTPSFSADTPVSEPYVVVPEIDWLAVALGLLAFTSVIGLVPFGIWVYSTFFPPVP